MLSVRVVVRRSKGAIARSAERRWIPRRPLPGRQSAADIGRRIAGEHRGRSMLLAGVGNRDRFSGSGALQQEQADSLSRFPVDLPGCGRNDRLVGAEDHPSLGHLASDRAARFGIFLYCGSTCSYRPTRGRRWCCRSSAIWRRSRRGAGRGARFFLFRGGSCQHLAQRRQGL